MSATDAEPSLADLFRNDPNVRITASGHVCPAACIRCVSFHQPQDKAAEWKGRMPATMYDKTLSVQLLADYENAPESVQKERGPWVDRNTIYPNRIEDRVFNKTFIDYGECRASGGKLHLLSMMQAHPEIKHGKKDFCTAGELSEAAVTEKKAEIAGARAKVGLKP